jgi:site-specific DNA-methyltransferase (adenine-specific)
MTNDNVVYEADNLEVLKTLPDGYAQLIYIDPPFNTGRRQTRKITRMKRDENGTHKGYNGANYAVEKVAQYGYGDDFDDFWGFLQPRLLEAYRLLAPTGTFYLHLDYREVHYARVELDKIFGRENFLNEIIWAYDYGAKAKNRWPAKHDNILVYVKDYKNYYFNNQEVDREPYMAPGLVTAEKVALGKLPTDVWWHTIVSPNSREKTGYPTQKPLGILKRIVAASSARGDRVLDFFAGSGATGAAAVDLGRNFTLIDSNPDAIKIMRHRFKELDVEWRIKSTE